MRKVYVITGNYEQKNKVVTKVLCVCSSIKKATKIAQKAEDFYDKIEIITEVLI